MLKVRTTPFYGTAMQYTGDNAEAIQEWMQGEFLTPKGVGFKLDTPTGTTLYVRQVGDWVVHVDKGWYEVWGDDTFWKTYEEVTG